MSAAAGGDGSNDDWYCHACHRTSSTPLMIPDPHCPNCRNACFERISEAQDDPRGNGFLAMAGPFFVQHGGDPDHTAPAGPQQMLNQMLGFPFQPGRTAHADDRYGSDRVREQELAAHHGEQVPVANLADFLQAAFGSPPEDSARQPAAPEVDGDGDERRRRSMPPQTPNPAAAIMRLFFAAFGAPGLGHFEYIGSDNDGAAFRMGNLGDYTTQQGLDDFITQLMEQANHGSTGPQPLGEEAIGKLPRFKMTQNLLDAAGSTECAICKDDYAIDETTLRLPCRHLFHADCITPWLKTSASCPVCRQGFQSEHAQATEDSVAASEGEDAAVMQIGGDVMPGALPCSDVTAPPRHEDANHGTSMDDLD